MEIEVALWEHEKEIKPDIQDFAERYALFQQLKVNRVEFLA